MINTFLVNPMWPLAVASMLALAFLAVMLPVLMKGAAIEDERRAERKRSLECARAERDAAHARFMAMRATLQDDQ
jgi:hypothetical protein